MTTRWLKLGQLVASRWQVVEPVGRGELGEVCIVRDMGNGMHYALKLLGAGFVQMPTAWLAFRKSMGVVSALPFDPLAKIREIGIDPLLTMPFIVSERMLWPSVRSHLAESGAFSAPRWATVLGAIAPALDAAHQAGVVHRDLTPENLFVDPEDTKRVRITDFGISILRAALPPPPGWAGPPGWVGPDGVQPSAPSTPQMDVLSLGLVTFFALTGHSAFRAIAQEPLDIAALWKEMTAPLPPASERARELGAVLHGGLDPWFARALAPDPAARFSSVGEMAEQFVAELDRVGLVASTRPKIASTEADSNETHEPVALVSSKPLAYLSASALPRRPPPPPAASSPDEEAPSAEPGPASDRVPPRRTGVGTLIASGVVLMGAGLSVGYWLSNRRQPRLGPELASRTAPEALSAAGKETLEAGADAAVAARTENSSVVVRADAAVADAAAADAAQATRVTFRCTPRCDSITCDGRVIVADGGVSFAPGQHYCVATAHGYVTHIDRFVVAAGKPAERAIELHKAEGRPTGHHHVTHAAHAPKCGTFINPCK